MTGILEMFIGIIAVAAPFALVAFIVYYRYKTKKALVERMSSESLGEWFKVEAEAKVLRHRGAALRWGGLFAGAGLGLLIATAIVLCVPMHAMTVTQEMTAEGGSLFSSSINYSFVMTFGLTLLFGGAGLIGGYFLERKLDKKS